MKQEGQEQEDGYLAAHAEGFERIETEPAAVPRLTETIHELFIQRPLERGETHQDHVLLFHGQLCAQDVMTTSEKKNKNTKPKTFQHTTKHFLFFSHTHTV